MFKTLCQPDGIKGCSVCCGLFNLRDISKKNLESFLSGDSSIDALNDVRDITSHICIHQSFISKNRPGCTLHPQIQGTDHRNSSLYGAKICEEYLCPAHSILNAEQKQLLVSSVTDWYLYSIAILDPEGFICIIDIIISLHLLTTSHNAASLISEALSFHANALSQSATCYFYYSQAEYNQHKVEFSLRYNFKEKSLLRKHLMNILDKGVLHRHHFA